MSKYFLLITLAAMCYLSSCKKNDDTTGNNIVDGGSLTGIKKKQPITLTGTNTTNEKITWQVTPTTGFTIDTIGNKAIFLFSAAGTYNILAKTSSITTQFKITVIDSFYNQPTTIDNYFYYSFGRDTVGIKSPSDTIIYTSNTDTTGQKANTIQGLSAGNAFTDSTKGVFNISFLDTTIGGNKSFKNASFYYFRAQSNIQNIKSSNLNITQYGAVGKYIEGNFTATLTKSIQDTTIYTVAGYFKILRTQ